MKLFYSPGPLLAGLAVAASTLVGCGQPQPVESTQSPAQPAVVQAPEQAPAAETQAQGPQPAREVGSVTPAAKPGAPVSLEYSLRGKPQVGEPVSIDLTFVAGGSGETLEIFCSADEALTLRDGAFTVSNPAGAASTHTITVTPQVEGYHYVNVIARMGSQARAFAVPVAVGDVDARDTRKPQGEIGQDETGQPLIRLPAEET